MAYVPNLADTQEALNSGAQMSGGYVPTLADTHEALAQSQMEGQPAQTNPTLLPRIGADALAGLAQFGHGLINSQNALVQNIAPPGYLKPGEDLPTLPAYDYGKMLGVNAPNLGDKLIQGAAQYAPYMAIPESALTQGVAFGLTQSQDPFMGGITSGLLGKAGELAPGAIAAIPSKISQLTSAIRPQKYAEQILSNLGGGNSLEGNAQSLAHDIQNAYQQQALKSSAQYNGLLNNLGANQIYNRVSPILGTSQKGNYENLGNNIFDNYTGDLKDLHNEFINNPTFSNAHQLQSQLGANIGSLAYQNSKGMLDAAGKNQLQAFRTARNSLLGDVNSYLGSQGVDAVSAYRSATNNYNTNVVPYLADSNLAQIAKGETSNPTYSQINSIFKSPEPEITKVVSDIGPQANNKILYNELGKTQANLTPEKLTNSFNQLDNKGLSSYVTPDLAQQFDQLASKTTARNAARTAGGALIGAHFGGPLGAAAGAVATPLLSSAITRGAQFLPSLRMQLLSNALIHSGAGVRPLISTIYKPLPGAIAADAINSMGGQ